MTTTASKNNSAPRRKLVAHVVSTPSQQQLEGLLESLSQALEETAHQYVVRLQHEIAQITAGVKATRRQGSVVPPTPKTLQALSKKFESLNIKPCKGRRKDLKRIDDLIGELENILHGA